MDAIQALQLAMEMIGLDLRHTYPGQFTIAGGNADPGFPALTK